VTVPGSGPGAGSNPTAGDPGTSDPGTTDPGTTDPGTTDPGTTDPGTTDPGTTDPGTTDPGTTDPGTTDPGTTDPGTTDPGTTDPGTTDPGTTDPTPPQPALQPLPTWPSFPGFDHVHGAAADPHTDVLYALDADTGALQVLQPGALAPILRATSNLRGVRALACDPADGTLLAVTDGPAGGDDVLQRVDPQSAAGVEIGPIAGHPAVEALAFGGTQADAVLYAVDAQAGTLLSVSKDSGTPTVLGPLGPDATDVRALTFDPASGLLLGVDAAHGDLVAIDPASGHARRMLTLAAGALECLACAPLGGTFHGVVRSDGALHQIDLRGDWIAWDRVLGVAQDPVRHALYGLQPDFGLVFEADATTGWRQPVVTVPHAGLAGLAADPAGAGLYAVSGSDLALVRIDPVARTEQTVATVQAAGGPWTGLDGLACGPDRLYAVHGPTSRVLSIDAATGAATVLTSFPDQTGIQSLTYDQQQDRLVAFAEGTHNLLFFPAAENAVPELLPVTSVTHVGGMAWDGDGLRLLGSDLDAGVLATVASWAPPGLGYDAVHALTFVRSISELRGFDGATTSWLRVDLGDGRASALTTLPGLSLEGLAYDPAGDTTYALDAASGSLLRGDATGTFTRIGAAGALSGLDAHALAFDASQSPGVLYTYDDATCRLVALSTTDATATPVGEPTPLAHVEAMAFHPGSGVVLAVDAAQRQIFQFDATTGVPTPVAPLEAQDVRAMAVVPGTDELVVVDAATNRLGLVDRYTGATLDAYADPVPLRGVERRLASLPWPRGDVRLAHLTTLAVEVADDHPAGSRLVMRRGKATLFEAPFEPTTIQSLLPFPAAARARLHVGDTVTWGLVLPHGKGSVLASFHVVDAAPAQRALGLLAAHRVLQRQPAWVRAVRQSRVLRKAGLASESLQRALVAAALRPSYVPATRALVRAERALAHQDGWTWSHADLLAWLTQTRGAKDGPWSLLAAPQPLRAATAARVSSTKRRP
jgi:hypothetical protein